MQGRAARAKCIRPTCSFDGCEKPAVARGLCSMHEARERRSGRIHLHPKMTSLKYETRLCEAEGCEGVHVARGMCMSHYREWERTQKTCSFPGCDKPTNARFCGMHAYREKMGYDDLSGQPIYNGRPQYDALARDASGYKKCASCEDWHPEQSFNKDQKSPDGLYRTCNACRSQARRLKRYGPIVLRLWDEQAGRCKICTRLLASDYSVDHDHYHFCGCGPDKGCEQCVRGLLCRGCNLGLGNFGDSPEALRNAAEYLESRIKTAAAVA